MIRIPIDPALPAASLLDLAARVIGRGELVVIPTDTFYGIAADPFNAAAVRRVFEVKGRQSGQPLPLIAGSVEQVATHVGPLSSVAARLAAMFWPGPLTLVVRAPGTLAPGVASGGGTVGIRVPDHAVARGLCAAATTLLTATSANLTGRPPSADPDEAIAGLEDRVAVLVDAGVTPGGLPSTIVDVSEGAPRLIRAGAVSWKEIERCVKAE